MEKNNAKTAAKNKSPDWIKTNVGFPAPKRQLTMRLDGDVIDWFKAQGGRYQTRINAVLRRFMEAHRTPQR